MFVVAQHCHHWWQVEFLGAERIVWAFSSVWDPILWFSPWYYLSAVTWPGWTLQKVTDENLHPTDDTYYQVAYLGNTPSQSCLRWEHPFCKTLSKDHPDGSRIEGLSGNWISKQAKTITESICNLQKHVISDVRRDLRKSSGLSPVQSRASSDIGWGCSEGLASAAGWESSWDRGRDRGAIWPYDDESPEHEAVSKDMTGRPSRIQWFTFRRLKVLLTILTFWK